MADMFKFELALEFLNNHPAINTESYSFFSSNIAWHVDQMCKNKVSKMLYETPEKLCVILCKDEPNFELMKQKYGEPDDKDYIYVPYREIYGCEWLYAKHQIYSNYSIFRYDKRLHDRYCKELLNPNYLAFMRYEMKSTIADTLEDLTIEIADEVKMNLGDFSYDDFLTEAEKENHKNVPSFIFKPIEDGMSEMLSNDSYISVRDAELNLRWWDWFKNTDYCKNKYSWIFEEQNEGF